MYALSLTSEKLISNKEKVTNIIPTWCILTIIFQGLVIFGYLYLRIFLCIKLTFSPWRSQNQEQKIYLIQ